jgi:hypothetical protein
VPEELHMLWNRTNGEGFFIRSITVTHASGEKEMLLEDGPSIL